MRVLYKLYDVCPVVLINHPKQPTVCFFNACMYCYSHTLVYFLVRWTIRLLLSVNEWARDCANCCSTPLFQDSSYQVRVRFARKLNAGLMTLKLPLQYLSIFSLAANDPVKERRLQCKVMLTNNITKRRDFLKQHSAAMSMFDCGIFVDVEIFVDFLIYVVCKCVICGLKCVLSCI